MKPGCLRCNKPLGKDEIAFCSKCRMLMSAPVVENLRHEDCGHILVALPSYTLSGIGNCLTISHTLYCTACDRIVTKIKRH